MTCCIVLPLVCCVVLPWESLGLITSCTQLLRECGIYSPGASGLMLYQCLTRYKGSDSSEISLNKNDIVKVLDKKDHGK